MLRISLNVDSVNVLTFLIFGAILSFVYSACYIDFIKFIDLDFGTIDRNSNNITNNSSIEIRNGVTYNFFNKVMYNLVKR